MNRYVYFVRTVARRLANSVRSARPEQLSFASDGWQMCAVSSTSSSVLPL